MNDKEFAKTGCQIVVIKDNTNQELKAYAHNPEVVDLIMGISSKSFPHSTSVHSVILSAKETLDKTEVEQAVESAKTFGSNLSLHQRYVVKELENYNMKEKLYRVSSVLGDVPEKRNFLWYLLKARVIIDLLLSILSSKDLYSLTAIHNSKGETTLFNNQSKNKKNEGHNN